jgi:hypothetical protein
MYGIPVEFFYPIFTFLMLLLTMLFVPRKEFKSLFWLSFIWGFGVSIFFVLIFSELLNLLKWRYAFPFTFYGSPVWLNIAWLFSIMIFLYYLPTQKEWYYFTIYLFGFAFASAILDQIFMQIGLLEYIHWNPICRFFVALAWFYGAAFHHHFMKEKGKLEH